MNSIEIVFLSLAGVMYVKMLFLRAITIHVDPNKSFERQRRLKKGDSTAKHETMRASVIKDLYALKYLIETASLIIFLVCLFVIYDWMWGSVIGFGLLLLIQPISRLSFFQKFAQKIYQKYEGRFLPYLKKIQPLTKFIYPNINQQSYVIESKEELIHLIESAPAVFSVEEKQLLTHALQFETTTVNKIMTPRSVVETVQADETLGPIVLDRLHKTGHSRFPVVEKDLDHTVGILYAHDFMTNLSSEQTVNVKQAMDHTVYYINQSHNLAQALATFLHTKHHLFIVVNEFEESVGVISIEDIMEALIGRKIVDEFDKYEDLRAVASRAATKRHKSEPRTKP